MLKRRQRFGAGFPVDPVTPFFPFLVPSRSRSANGPGRASLHPLSWVWFAMVLAIRGAGFPPPGLGIDLARARKRGRLSFACPLLFLRVASSDSHSWRRRSLTRSSCSRSRLIPPALAAVCRSLRVTSHFPGGLHAIALADPLPLSSTS